VIDADGVIDIEPSPVKKKARTVGDAPGEPAQGKRKIATSDAGTSPSKRQRLGIELEEEGFVILDEPDEAVEVPTTAKAAETVQAAADDMDVIVIEDD